LDFAGILSEYSYIEAKRYVNATLRIVEKRQVDVENKIIMNLVNGVLYTIVIGDGDIYTFGDLRVTDDTTIVLTLKAVDFPKETLLTYNYVRIYGLRALGSDGYALSFDGTNDYVKGNTSCFPQQPFTLEAWIRPDSITTGTKTIIAVRYGRVWLYQSGNDLIFSFWDGTNLHLASELNVLNTADWFHVVVTKDNVDGIILYLDGTVVDTNAVAGAKNNVVFVDQILGLVVTPR